MTCRECGWPGVGKTPTGVRQLNRGERAVLVGQLTYISTVGGDGLCSVCKDMQAAVEERPWFVEAHGEFLEQVKTKKRLLGGSRERP